MMPLPKIFERLFSGPRNVLTVGIVISTIIPALPCDKINVVPKPP